MGQPDDAPAGADPYVQLEAGSVHSETQSGTIMGSPWYMSPEVATGLTDEIDQRSDVYLLGATLYEILTGHMPRDRRQRHGDDHPRQARELPVPPRKIDAQGVAGR